MKFGSKSFGLNLTTQSKKHARFLPGKNFENGKQYFTVEIIETECMKCGRKNMKKTGGQTSNRKGDTGFSQNLGPHL
jgi:hypothetical protein